MEHGTIVNWSNESGWGFIKADNGQKYFLHFNNCEVVPRKNDGFVDLKRGCRVTFVAGKQQSDGKAPLALQVNVQPVSTESAAA